VLRTALKPRWLGLLAVLVAVVVSFTWLGLWQLDLARDRGRARTQESSGQSAPVSLDAVARPHGPFPTESSGRLVRVAGEYASDGQFLVTPRRLDGRPGHWVVTPLVARETGATIAVVRGFAEDPSTVEAPPAGPVAVTGALAPGESPAPRPEPAVTGAALPGGQLGSVDLAVLVNRWPGQAYNAFLFATAEQAAPAGAVSGRDIPAGEGLRRVPPPVLGGGGLVWRNAAYALQWWVFAAFAAYMWFRMVRDDARRDRGRERQESGT
jgi:cytochrome oxidase assembly protein ShyY1